VNTVFLVGTTCNQDLFPFTQRLHQANEK